jgi:tetratricopeptide (TPR) repeat protein
LRFRLFIVSLLLLCLVASGAVAAADTWFEIKSPNFVVWANANDGNTRTLIWQLEQIRSVVKTLWPWAKVDLAKPIVIIAVKNEQSMKELVPWYWLERDGIRPGSVWVSGADQHYLAVRADMRAEDNVLVNPHASTYFSYVNLILGSSFERELPMWTARGLAGVVSNTLVRSDHVLVGATIPWHLEQLRDVRMPVRQLIAHTRNTPSIKTGDGLRRFDANAWLLVHYLVFSEGGAHSPKLSAFIEAVNAGTAPEAAFAATLGNPDDYDRAVSNYVSRNLFSAAKLKIDSTVTRERFAARPMTVAESAGGRAAFRVAMGRLGDAATLIAEARKADPNSVHAQVAEALSLDRLGNQSEAKAAYRAALQAGTTNAFVHYRAAMLEYPNPSEETMAAMERDLAKAVELQPSFAAAHAGLAELRAALKRPEGTIVPHMRKAIELEPAEPWHLIAAARTLWRLNVKDEARKAAERALRLASADDQARAEAQRLLEAIK